MSRLSPSTVSRRPPAHADLHTRLGLVLADPAAGTFVQLAAHAAANPLARAFVDWLQEEARRDPAPGKSLRRPR